MTSPALEPVTHLDPEVLSAYLEKTRWFGGKGRPFTVSGVRRLGRLGELGPDRPLVDVLLVELGYADADPGSPEAVELYQVPLAYYAEPEHRLDRAFIGWWEDPEHGWVHAYDALHDREATCAWLHAFGEAADAPASVGGLTFHRLPGFELDLEATGSLFSGEQSNSSVLFGEDSVMKLFRKVTVGANPDITTHEALTRAGSTHVASLYGWVEVGEGDQLLHLGMLQQFLRTATDGWDLALASIRTLFNEPDVNAVAESGGDFAGEADRLGEALREIHETMRAELPTPAGGAPTPQSIAEAMAQRLERAVAIVPGLAEHSDALHAAYAAVGALPRVTVQQIHGDLHLGQTLRTALGWKIVDFEGEPAKPLAERLLPDSPWRDVAGMLRSFDYAPHAVEQQQGDVDEEDAAARRALGQDWSERSKERFLRSYAGGELSDEERLLVDAYVADKAVYETVYETRNRPTWVGIPLAAVARIGGSA